MHFADYKTILSPNNGMNIYRGCTHGCIYCDSRSDCYQMKHAFDDIEVKRGAPEILEAQLIRRRKPCVIGTGSMCDPYIHIEEELRITRRCLEVIHRRGFGVAIHTKSARILRDIDILSAINSKTKAVAQITLTAFDEDLCRITEPYVSTTKERFNALCALKEAGIPTVVWLSPFLPFINDTEENLRGLIDYCARAGVKGVIHYGFGTTMRGGSREYFYSKLDKHFPGMKERYIRAFGGAYECGSPNSARLAALLKTECDKRGIMRDSGDVFNFMYTLPSKAAQITL